MSALDPKRTCPLQGRKFSRYHRLVWLGAPVGGRAVRDGAVPVRGARRRVALDLGGGAGAAGGADRRVVGGVVEGASNQCPLYPKKRTLELGRGMSALCQKRTFAYRCSRNPW